jgi:hypothetical protein
VAIAVGALWAVLDPNGPWIAAVLGALVVLFIPDVQPWVVARLRRPGELTCLYRRPTGAWSPGTLKLLEAGVRWRADDDDVEPRELVLLADRFGFGGFTGERPKAELEALELRTAEGGIIELAVPVDRSDQVSSRFRIARDLP